MAEEQRKNGELAKAVAHAYVRSSKDLIETASVVADGETKRRLKLVTRPPKVSSSLRKAGVLLVLAPDPVTLVPGLALLGAGYALKKREPAGISDLVRETARTMRDLQSLL